MNKKIEELVDLFETKKVTKKSFGNSSLENGMWFVCRKSERRA